MGGAWRRDLRLGRRTDRRREVRGTQLTPAQGQRVPDARSIDGDSSARRQAARRLVGIPVTKKRRGAPLYGAPRHVPRTMGSSVPVATEWYSGLARS